MSDEHVTGFQGGTHPQNDEGPSSGPGQVPDLPRTDDDGSSSDPAQVPDLPHTGDVAVDEALATLDGVTEASLPEQVGTYVGVHRRLQDRLADLDG